MVTVLQNVRPVKNIFHGNSELILRMLAHLHTPWQMELCLGTFLHLSMSRSYVVTILLPHFTWVTLAGCSSTEGKCGTLLNTLRQRFIQIWAETRRVLTHMSDRLQAAKPWEMNLLRPWQLSVLHHGAHTCMRTITMGLEL